MVAPEIEAQVCSAAGAILFRDPGHRLIPILKEKALHLLQMRLQPNLSQNLGDFLLGYVLWTGDVSFGRQIILEVDHQIATSPIIPIYEVLWNVMKMVFLGVITVETKEALLCHDRAAKMIDELGLSFLFSMVHGNAAFIMLLIGDVARAAETMATMEKVVPRHQLMDVSFRLHLKACLANARGNWSEAEKYANEAIEVAENCGVETPVNLIKLGLGHAYIGQEKYEIAKQCFEWSIALGDKIQSPFFKHHGLVGLALVSLAQGNRFEAKIQVEKALQFGREQGYFSIHPWIPARASRLLAFALEENIEPDYARMFIKRRGLLPPMPNALNWPLPIRLSTLGHFAIELDGEPIAFGRKTPKKDLALLKLLISAGNKGLSESRIGDDLWRDADGDRAANSLKQTLHRLRGLLQDHEAIESNDGLLKLNPNKIWIDAWAFEANASSNPPLNGDSAEIRRYGHRLLESYPGNFLPEDSDLPFLVSARERLRATFVRQISTIAEHLIDASSIEDSVDLFRKAVEIDPLVEGFHQGLMRCFLKLNRVADGIAVYERLRRLLIGHWKTEPSATSRALFEKLHAATPPT